MTSDGPDVVPLQKSTHREAADNYRGVDFEGTLCGSRSLIALIVSTVLVWASNNYAAFLCEVFSRNQEACYLSIALASWHRQIGVDASDSGAASNKCNTETQNLANQMTQWQAAAARDLSRKLDRRVREW